MIKTIKLAALALTCLVTLASMYVLAMTYDTTIVWCAGAIATASAFATEALIKSI